MTNGFSTFLNLYANNGLSLSYRMSYCLLAATSVYIA